jgi:ribose transport system permease protein
MGVSASEQRSRGTLASSGDLEVTASIASAETMDSPDSEPSSGRRRRVDLKVDRYSGLYLSIILLVVYSLWMPATFGTLNNFRVIIASEAITGILTIGLIVSLISGAFDVSVAANMAFAVSLVGWLQASHHLNPALAILLTLLAGTTIGATNAFVITKLHVEPVIATLGMSSILAALAYWVAGGKTIIDGISPAFSDWGSHKVFTVSITVFYLAAVAVVIWYWLEHTPTGRYLYAAGANPQATRLAGLNVVRLQWVALMVSGTLASLAGVVLTMQLGASSFGAGLPYLLPAFAAAFLGSTQVKPGRFNVRGTLVALYLLAIGVKGLQLRYPSLPWIKDVFEGLALIIAVALAARSARKRANA